LISVVGAFPDGNSAINPAAARLRHIAGTRWTTKFDALSVSVNGLSVTANAVPSNHLYPSCR
jgi:hypothetical protein